MKIIYSSHSARYCQPLHPESPQRVLSSFEFLQKKQFTFAEPKECSEEDILLVHSKELLEEVRAGSFLDPDTPAFPDIFHYAKLSAGAAIQAAESALQDESAFSLMRPPGHHAKRDQLGGFCYFNNIAIAVARVKDAIGKVAIIDFDCHHGNGTEDIFHGAGDVMYVSLHQSPLYPGTGLVHRKNCRNYPLERNTSHQEYLNVFERTLKEVQDFNPALLAVSAGFDAYEGDPITQMNLEKKTFHAIGARLALLDKPVFAILEGGYSQDLGACIFEFLSGLES